LRARMAAIIVIETPRQVQSIGKGANSCEVPASILTARAAAG